MALACQKFSPVDDVMPASLRAPVQSYTKFSHRPSGSCIHSTNSSSPRAHPSTSADAVADQTSQSTSSNRAVSSTQATPSNPDSLAATSSPLRSV